MTPTAADLVGPLQLRILKYLWSLPQQPGVITVHKLTQAMNYLFVAEGKPQLAYTTYLTVMRNLARRKFVDQTKGLSRGHNFTVLVSQAEYEKRALGQILHGLYDGDKARMIEAVGAV